jgi:hypothetical protein
VSYVQCSQPCLPMGACHSTSSRISAAQIAWSMPPFCLEQPVVNLATIDLAATSWSHNMSGESPAFLAAAAAERGLTPVSFFYNRFYSLLFELIPESKKLFKKGMKGQGRMLANTLKFMLIQLRVCAASYITHEVLRSDFLSHIS